MSRVKTNRSQNKSVPSAEQVRDNQRRSRARHKEFVDDLKRRIQEYERNGVEVTKEIQQTARRVHEDNLKLRQLLAQKGVSDAETNSFLSGSDPPANPLPPPKSVASPIQTPTPPVDTHFLSRTLPPPIHRHSEPELKLPPMRTLEDNAQLERLHVDPALAGPRMLFNDMRRAGSISEMECESQDSEPHIRPISRCPPSEASSCRPISTQEMSETIRSPHETSCEDAASIIAGMRGHADREQVREELGCGGRRNCAVKNMTLFQLMDQSS
ncbi:bZIP transcription factor-like protein [Venturia nashicola]|nr:bZIP transcription factor-like protein [Venturia nashicola]